MKRTWYKKVCALLLILPLALQVNVFSIKAEEVVDTEEQLENSVDAENIADMAEESTEQENWESTDTVTPEADFYWNGTTITGYIGGASDIVIPARATEIGAEAFRWNYKIKSVKFEQGSQMQKIGTRAFDDCRSLTRIDLPAKLTTIGRYAFGGCESLVQIDFPDTLTAINEGAFQNCTMLSSVIIPCNITKLENDAFDGCTSLSYVKIESVKIEESGGAFSGCNSLETVVLPEGMKKIPKYLLSSMPFLKSITIPSTVEEIEQYAFSNCPRLTSVKFTGTKLRKIGKYAFSRCETLPSVIIPESVQILEYGAFSYCKALQNFTVPKNVTKVGKECFAGDAALKTYRCESVKADYEYSTNYQMDGAFVACMSVTLYGYTGSTTEEYAKQVGRAFISLGNPPGYVHPAGWYTENGKLYCYDEKGQKKTNQFAFDGQYTYYLQADGTPMKDRLTYHPDGEHIIYLDTEGHEVFTNFQFCPSVGYTCYFDSQGYLYKDQITFVGDKVYYLNANGAMEQNGWFQFANGMDYGCANSNGTLVTTGFSYDPYGRVVFYHWNGMVARGLISDGAYYYSMDTGDGHYLGQFPVQ